MKQKKILIIKGHPDNDSYNYAIAEAYKRGVNKTSSEIREINIRDLNFNPNLQYGYKKRPVLEPDLVKAQEAILWAEHLVWIYPVWWGSVPAIMKGFIDRVFHPGFAFKRREKSYLWDRYLKGKTARLICTLDQPAWYYALVYRKPSHNAMKKATLKFVGIKRVKITTVGPVRLSSEKFRKNWLRKIEKLGEMNR
jgi:putative NADPH-quinone reductase